MYPLDDPRQSASNIYKVKNNSKKLGKRENKRRKRKEDNEENDTI